MINNEKKASKYFDETTVSTSKDYSYWSNLCKEYLLSEEFMEHFSNKINFASIVKYQYLSNTFILKHYKELFDQLIINQRLKINTLKFYFKNSKIDFMDLTSICEYQTLTNNFIKNYIITNPNYGCIVGEVLLTYQKINYDLINLIFNSSKNIKIESLYNGIKNNRIISEKNKNIYIEYIKKSFEN